MKMLLIICLFLLPGHREMRAFERLNRLYPTEPAACQQLANKYLSKHNDWSTPHYFMGLLYLDQYTKQEQIQKKRRYLQKALSEYTLVQRYKSYDKVMLLSDDQLKPKLIEAINVEVQAEENEEQREMWFRKAKKAHLEIMPFVAKKVEIKNPEILKLHWYQGMPTGTEALVSANPEGERAILSFINAERKKLGLKPLIWDEDLAKAARYHSADMATENYFAHSSHDRSGSDLIEIGGAFDRIKKFYNHGFAHSENIAAGNRDPHATYLQWFHSPGHYKNMFKANSTKAGIGVYFDPNSTFGWYWTFCGAQN